MKRFLLVLAVLFVLSLVVAGVTFYTASGRTALPGGSKILRVSLSGSLPEYAAEPTLPFTLQRSQTLINLFQALTAAAGDDSVEVVVVEISSPRMGLARAQEVLRLLTTVREAGKKIHCFAETFGEGTNGTLDYYLSTACDRLTLAPAGDLNLLGLFWDLAYYRGTLDKLKIEPDFYQAGVYKGTGETFMRQNASAEAAESYGGVLDDLYGQIVSAVASARGLPAESVAGIIDGAPYASEEALAMGLVDALAHRDTFRQGVEDGLAGDARWMDVDDYFRQRSSTGPIAVVFAQGTIVRGDGAYDPWTNQRFVGSDDLAGLLEDLEEDDSVRAVVLRINSPGGSALASDLILRSVQRLAESKPVVVSMSDIAASGGYYIAARANRVLAERATITGSIGVVFGKVATRNFESEMLGITHDSLQRGQQANYFSLLDRFSDSQAERVRQLMQNTYERFTGHVAEGRGMSPEAVERAAGGRIWTGAQALELGLVDEVGGLGAAIAAAGQEAGIEVDFGRLRTFPRAPSLLQFLEQQQAVKVADLLRYSLPFSPPRSLEIPAEASSLAAPF